MASIGLFLVVVLWGLGVTVMLIVAQEDIHDLREEVRNLGFDLDATLSTLNRNGAKK